VPLIHKRRIWWEPVPEAKSYMVYVLKEDKSIAPVDFLWENTPGIIPKLVVGKTEIMIPDDWPEFPVTPGTYHIGITSMDDVGNQSDPFVLSGLFRFVAPRSPSRGGIESLPFIAAVSDVLVQSGERQGRKIIQGSLEEVKSNKELGDTYFKRT
jgi:hypothetical protein